MQVHKFYWCKGTENLGNDDLKSGVVSMIKVPDDEVTQLEESSVYAG